MGSYKEYLRISNLIINGKRNFKPINFNNWCMFYSMHQLNNN